jgi:hypothetical protein
VTYSALTNVTAGLTDPAKKILVAAASANTKVYTPKNYLFGTLPPGSLYVVAAFRSLSTFNASRVAVLRDNNDPMCFESTVRAVDPLYPVNLYAYYSLDPKSPQYIENIRTILLDLKSNNVESLLGCSYMDLCIQVSFNNISLDVLCTIHSFNLKKISYSS